MTPSPLGASAPARRALPSRPSFERQKKLAKALLRDAVSGDTEALNRLLASHPDPADLQQRPPRLADAQVVLAREYGLPSWPALKRHVFELTRMANQIDEGSPAPDGALDTVHLRCGSDIRDGLVEAGFGGEFLEFADPMCRGPLPDAPLSEYLAVRGAWIAETWGGSAPDARKRLTDEYAALARASERERLVLWFEHDPYDQLILARVLAEIGGWQTGGSSGGGPGGNGPGGNGSGGNGPSGNGPTVELILLNDYPGVGRLVGLGQLPPPALRSLWERRRPVTAEMIELAGRVWAGLTAADPRALVAIIEAGTPELPTMAGALRRHLAELPGVRDGLALLERLTLQALADGAVRGGPLFGRVMKLDPLPFLGDTMMAEVLRILSGGDRPAVEVIPQLDGTPASDEPWHKKDWGLTEFGQRLLAGQEDWMATEPPVRWVGGVRIESGQPVWRWDPEGGGVRRE